MKRLVIDPGHGGHDPGACGHGLAEADIVLDVSLKLALAMEHLADVFLTRRTDEFLTLSERARKSNDLGSDLFISIHCNCASNKSAKGFELFTSPGETKADPVAKVLYDRWEKDRPLGADSPMRRGNTSGPDKEANFTVLAKTNAPAVLVELGFISNQDEAERMGEAEYQERIVDCLMLGIRQAMGLNHSISPPLPAASPYQIAWNDLGKSGPVTSDFVAGFKAGKST